MIEGVADNPRDRAVLRGIVCMAQALGLEITAEGVETEAQRAVVIEEGCTAWQGFLGAEPLSAAEFARFT
jgi:EAL domain-containing protein (putative c-di-GMP-specific phosphodiesterase class I)